MGDTIITAKKIRKEFGGVTALNDLSLHIRKGQITGIIGPNGSGKTTFVNVLTGMLAMDGGCAVIGPREHTFIRRDKCPSLGLTRTFQLVRLIGQMSVWDNLMLVFAPKNPFTAIFSKDNPRQIARAKELLEMMGLYEKRFELAENLSYGERKLLEIARALAMNTVTFFFDEPFAGLFSEMIDKVERVMRQLAAQDRAVVLIEHNMDIIRALCSHILFLDEGKLMAEGDANAVFSRHEVLEAYLGE